MKELKLKSIVLKDFKGQNIEVVFNEKATTIKGKNGKGKTTIQKAWNWLWSGWTDAVNVKNHELFDSTKELSPNTPIASVKAEITLDGYDYTIERTAEAKFVRKRASNEYEKASSDVYQLKIDNIETSNTDFNQWVEKNICPIDMVTYVLDGTFFANLVLDDKQKARKMLEGIVGEIKEKDYKGDYKELFEKMKRFSIEQIKEQTKKSIRPLNARSKEIDTEVSSKEKSISEYEQENFELLFAQIKGKKTEVAELDKQILGASDAIKPILEERTKQLSDIASKEAEVNSCRIKYEADRKAEIDKYLTRIDAINEHNDQIKRENSAKERAYNGLKSDMEYKSKLLKNLEKEREDLLARRNSVKERIFDGDKCAYCGQELPEDMLEEAKDKFNKQKKSELDVIVDSGKAVKARIDGLKKEIRELEELIKEGYETKELESSDELHKEMEKVQSSYPSYEDTDECKMLNGMIEKMRMQVVEVPQVDNEELVQRKEKLMDDLEELNRRYGRKSDMDKLINEIKSLQDEKVEVGCQIAELEGVLDNIAAYESEKANIVSERVNRNLEGCEFQMWSTLKSGDRVEDCVLMSKEGIKYSSINNSNRIKMCLSLQKMFCKYFGIITPYFLDEASIFDSTNMPKFDTQTIYLLASDDDKLIVE